MRTCESCFWFGPYSPPRIEDGTSGQVFWTKDELRERGLCHRLSESFAQRKTLVCSLHETKWEHLLFLRWIFPHYYLFLSRKLAKQVLDREKGLLYDRGALRSALKCAYDSLVTQLDFYKKRTAPPNVDPIPTPQEYQVLSDLDLLGSCAHIPILQDIVEDHEIRRPDLGVFGWVKQS